MPKRIGLVVFMMLALAGLYAAPASRAQEPATPLTPEQQREVIENLPWPETVRITFTAETWIWESNGIPNHEVADHYNPPPDAPAGAVFNLKILEQDFHYALPLIPEYVEATVELPGGAVAVALSGAVFFNPYTRAGTPAQELEAEIFDDCGGHPDDQLGAYHYHGNPTCLTEVLDEEGEHSHVIGFAFDGFPIYGLQGADGEPPTDLDECNGHFEATPEYPDGMYHYHTSEAFPYTFNCYHGVVDSRLLGPAQGGGQAGQGAQGQPSRTQPAPPPTQAGPPGPPPPTQPPPPPGGPH